MVAKLAGYLTASSYSEYLKSQITYARQWITEGEKRTLSSALNNDLKIISNTFGYTLPKLLSLLEDVVKRHALKQGIRSKIDYTHVKMAFESFHLQLGLMPWRKLEFPFRRYIAWQRSWSFPSRPTSIAWVSIFGILRTLGVSSWGMWIRRSSGARSVFGDISPEKVVLGCGGLLGRLSLAIISALRAPR